MGKKICTRRPLPEYKWWELGYVADWEVFLEKAKEGNVPLVEEHLVTYRRDEVHSSPTTAGVLTAQLTNRSNR